MSAYHGPPRPLVDAPCAVVVDPIAHLDPAGVGHRAVVVAVGVVGDVALGATQGRGRRRGRIAVAIAIDVDEPGTAGPLVDQPVAVVVDVVAHLDPAGGDRGVVVVAVTVVGDAIAAHVGGCAIAIAIAVGVAHGGEGGVGVVAVRRVGDPGALQPAPHLGLHRTAEAVAIVVAIPDLLRAGRVTDVVVGLAAGVVVPAAADVLDQDTVLTVVVVGLGSGPVVVVEGRAIDPGEDPFGGLIRQSDPEVEQRVGGRQLLHELLGLLVVDGREGIAAGRALGDGVVPGGAREAKQPVGTVRQGITAAHRALVCFAVTVVVDAVADLGGAGEGAGRSIIAVVDRRDVARGYIGTVHPQVHQPAVPEAISVLVGGERDRPLVDPSISVVVDAVADLDGGERTAGQDGQDHRPLPRSRRTEERIPQRRSNRRFPTGSVAPRPRTGRVRDGHRTDAQLTQGRRGGGQPARFRGPPGRPGPLEPERARGGSPG